MTPVCVFVWASEGMSYITVPPAEVAALSIQEKLSIPSSPQIWSLCNSLINKRSATAASGSIYTSAHLAEFWTLYGSGNETGFWRCPIFEPYSEMDLRCEMWCMRTTWELCPLWTTDTPLASVYWVGAKPRGISLEIYNPITHTPHEF